LSAGKGSQPGSTAHARRRKRAVGTDEFGLTPKERRFCDAFLADADQNRRKAYIAAGYTHKTMQKVDRGVYLIMRRPQVIAYLRKRQLAMRRNTEIGQSRVVTELANIGFLDPADLFDSYGALKHIQDVPLHARKAIAQIDVFTEYEGRGNDREAVGSTTRIKFVDKKGALDSIARILGFFQQDKIDTDGVAKLMDMIAQQRGGSTIGRLNSVSSSGGPLLGPVVATQQSLHDSGQGGERGPLPAQLGADGTARKLLVHERDLEGSPAGDDDVHRHTAAG
jgi:phage terminase small subunit